MVDYIVGDKVKVVSKGSGMSIGDIGTVIGIDYIYTEVQDENGKRYTGFHQRFRLVKKGDSKVEEVKQELPDYVIIVKNTEVFKKGGVFKNYSNQFYSPEDANKAFTVKPYGDEYIRPEQVRVLLAKKVAVPAVKFSPEFVTVEQNEILQKAMEPAKKTVKKTTKKTTKKA